MVKDAGGEAEEGARMVKDAVEALLAELASREESVPSAPEAALALALAERIDDPRNKATAAAMAAGMLLKSLEAVRALAPAKAKESPLDEIRARRDRRVSGAAARGAAEVGQKPS